MGKLNPFAGMRRSRAGRVSARFMLIDGSLLMRISCDTANIC